MVFGYQRIEGYEILRLHFFPCRHRGVVVRATGFPRINLRLGRRFIQPDLRCADNRIEAAVQSIEWLHCARRDRVATAASPASWPLAASGDDAAKRGELCVYISCRLGHIVRKLIAA